MTVIKTFQLRGTASAGYLPSDLLERELFVNLADGTLYSGGLGGGTPVQIGGGGSGGGGSGPASTDALPEGTTNLYFTQARVRAAISVTGSLAYNATTGVISYTAPALAAVATSGAYADLTGKPVLFSGAYTDLTGKPAFAAVATSGSASDLAAGTLPVACLPASGVTAGTYTNATVTFDAKGRATSATSGAAGGTGTVTSSGTPTSGQLAIFTTATNVAGVSTLPATNFPALTGAVTTTAGSLATTLATGVVAYANLASAAVASAASDIWTNVASKVVTVTALWAAQAPVALGSISGTYTLDFSTLLRGTATISASLTLANPTNTKPGQTGSVLFTMGAAGLTISYGSAWKPVAAPGATPTTPTAPTTSGALCLLSWEVYASGQIVYSLVNVGA